MKKIAFLFLVINDPNFPKLWDKYFRGHKDKYTIYIHPKNPEETTWKKNRIIKNLKETGWGFIVRAYMELLKEAYKDLDNYKFVVISESCLPIKTFDNFYDDATSDSRSWIKFMKLRYYNWEGRIKKEPNVPKDMHFIKHYARFCLNRDHVGELIKNEEKLDFFYNMQVGDEYFLSVIYPIKNVKDFAVTYDDWDYVHKKLNIIKDKKKKLYEEEERDKVNKTKELKELQDEYNRIAKNPKLITNIGEEINKINKCSSYFYRKFSKESIKKPISEYKLASFAK
jgi:hypothetical protein